MATNKKQPEIIKSYPIFECSPGIPITYKYNKTQSEEDNIASTTSTMITSLKMDRRNKAPKKRHVKISTHHTVEMIQVTISFQIKTKMTKKTPPLKNDGAKIMI